MAGALDGLKVVDITQGACGPFASQLMAYSGADVVKVEPPEGDYARYWGPPFIGGESAVFLALNRHKRSVALNLATAEGREILAALLGGADVFLEDLGPGGLASLGIEPGKANPRLIHCSISAFGEEGPLKDLAGSELVIQAMSDYWGSLGAIGEPPERLGADVANINTAIFAFDAVLAALFHRARTGVGQRVAVSMYGTLLHMRGIMWAAQTDPDDWYGFHCDTYVKPRDHGYRTKDRPIYFSLRRMDEESWVRLLAELNLLDRVIEDPRFWEGGREAVGTGRYAHEVKPIWEEAFKDRSSAELIELLSAYGAEAVPVNDYESLFAHPQVETLGIVDEVNDPERGPYRVLLPPWYLEGLGIRRDGKAPALGEHTREVLRELGYGEEEVARLEAAGVVRSRS
jgi:crotonobetainyl-CoA:carnitine CoA-transferase CaiB-like acyl-CoA transferase